MEHHHSASLAGLAFVLAGCDNEPSTIGGSGPTGDGGASNLAGSASDGGTSSACDVGLIPCVLGFTNRSNVNAPSKAPAKGNIPFALSPGSK